MNVIQDYGNQARQLPSGLNPSSTTQRLSMQNPPQEFTSQQFSSQQHLLRQSQQLLQILKQQEQA